MISERVKRQVTRQIRFCTGPADPRESFVPSDEPTSEHRFTTAFLCVWHIQRKPGCPDHEVQILGDWYDSIEVPCELCARAPGEEFFLEGESL